MLTRIDEILYPNKCEVVEVLDGQYVYPIFKNGSNSIKVYAEQEKKKIYLNNQIKKLEEIHVFLRDPMERFLSGINEYVFYTLRENPHLDLTTILFFVEKYLFLDRHYSLQLGWLFNLSRYTNSNCTLILHNVSELNQYTPLRIESKEQQVLDSDVINRLQSNKHADMYLRLDKLLVELINQKLTYLEIVEYIKGKDPIAFSKINVLSKT